MLFEAPRGGEAGRGVGDSTAPGGGEGLPKAYSPLLRTDSGGLFNCIDFLVRLARGGELFEKGSAAHPAAPPDLSHYFPTFN